MSDDATKSETETKAGVQPDGARPADKDRPENTQRELGERLDDALEETFPSSDPVSVKITK